MFSKDFSKEDSTQTQLRGVRVTLLSEEQNLPQIVMLRIIFSTEKIVDSVSICYICIEGNNTKKYWYYQKKRLCILGDIFTVIIYTIQILDRFRN